jgi:hypothetical protein
VFYTSCPSALNFFCFFFLHLLVCIISPNYQPDVTNSSINNGALGVGFAYGCIYMQRRFYLLKTLVPLIFSIVHTFMYMSICNCVCFFCGNFDLG